MTEQQRGLTDTRATLNAAVAALRARIPSQPQTQLLDIAAASDQALEELLQVAQGRLAVVLLRLRYDAIYREDGPPPPAPADLELRVAAHAADLVRSNVRGSDVLVRVGPTEQAVIMLQSGPLEARAQVNRLRSLVASQRFTYRGFEVQWRGRLGLATHQGAATILGARRVLQQLFATAGDI